MRIIQGQRITEITAAEFAALHNGFAAIHIDVGTGSGRFILQNAKKNTDVFYIGIDPAADSMKETAYKAQKYFRQSKRVCNAMFIVTAIENIPDKLYGMADSISVMLPWGSLLSGMVTADPQILQPLRTLGRADTDFDAIIGYDEYREEAEKKRRSLPTLSPEYLHSLSDTYASCGIAITKIEEISNAHLKQLPSDWARKLGHGMQRVMYRLQGKYSGSMLRS